jgi:hypothetical protein
MTQLAKTAHTLVLVIILAPQGFGQPERPRVESDSAASAQKRPTRAQGQQSAEREAVRSLTSAVAEIRHQMAEQQQLVQELKTAQAERDQDISIQRDLVRYTRWLVYVGAIQFIALIFQALIFFLTLKRIETQANLMRVHALHLENLSAAARDNAVAARANVDALISSERAWILVDTGEIPDNFDANQNSVGILDVRPVLRNSGRTPGWITRGFIRSFSIPTGSQLPPEPDYSGGLAEVPVNIIVAPNGFIQALHVPIPLSVFAAARQGTQKLYVYGFVDYSDFANQAGPTRQSRFCIEYHVPGGFDPQARGFYLAVDVPIAYTRCT